MSDYLPEEIITAILVRLPVKSLIRFTTVCKLWRSLITSPRFASTHISISEKSEDPSKTLLLRRYDKQLKREIYSLLELAGNSPANARSCMELDFRFICRMGYYRIVGSFHGLMCLSDDLFWDRSTTIILWNPLVRNHVILPKALCKPDEPHYFVLGFGSAADDYKVVRLVYRSNRNHGFNLNPFLDAEIYSLNLGKWRVLSGANVRLRVPDFIWSQVFLNGFVHWLAYDYVDDGSVKSSILAFDLSNEVFSKLTLPSLLKNEKVMRLSISVIASSLAVLKYDVEGESKSCDVWMMKDYRSNESWTKLYKINFNFSDHIAKVIAFSDSGEALLALSGNEIALYDPESKQFKNIGIFGAMRSLYLGNYMGSMLLFGRRSEVVEDEFKGSIRLV